MSNKVETYTDVLLGRPWSSVADVMELTCRPTSWIYNSLNYVTCKKSSEGRWLWDTYEIIQFSAGCKSTRGHDIRAKQLCKRYWELKKAKSTENPEVEVAVDESPMPITEITEGDKLITLQGETVQVTKAILPTGDTVAVHHVQPTTEEEVTDAHSIPEVTLKSDTDSMYSFSNLFDAVAITLITIFFTTAVLMVAFKIQLFGLSWHNLTDLLHFIDENFLGFL